MNGQVNLFDVKSGSQMATVALSGPVRAIFFSENGIWFAAAAKGASTISVWDLRKIGKPEDQSIVTTLDVGSEVESIAWDYTGQFLLTGGPDGVSVQQYTKATKAWTEPFKSTVPATRVAWGPAAGSIFAATDTGVINTFGKG